MTGNDKNQLDSAHISSSLQSRVHVDGISGGKLVGWGWYPDRALDQIKLEILVDGSLVGFVEPDAFRTDLAAARIRQGYAAFAFVMPDRVSDGKDHLVVARLVGQRRPCYSAWVRLDRPDINPNRLFGAGGLLLSGREVSEATATNGSGSYLAIAEAMNVAEALKEVARVTIVIPVFNAPEHVRGCLRSVTRCTTAPIRILVVDDASTDPNMATVLSESCAADMRIFVVRNSANLGYTKTVNQAIHDTDGDVVLLNSDTV